MVKPLLQLLILVSFCLPASGADTLPVKKADTATPEVSFSYLNKDYHFLAKRQGSAFVFNEKSNKALNIATLEWPPYVGRELCDLGWSLQLAIAVLTAKGYRVKVHFYPWVRAVMMVESGQMEILYPEYFIEDSAPSDIYPDIKRRELLVQSNELLGGNISLFKRKNSPFEFNGKLKVIAGMVIGVVRGYQNTPEFDAMMDKGIIRVVEAVDDAQLLKLLMGNRVDLIIGDPQVFQYVIQSPVFDEQTRQALQNTLVEVRPALKYNHLYFAVSTKYPRWKQLLEDINLSLLEFESSGESLRIYQSASHCQQQ